MLHVELSRKVHFSAAHRYSHPHWTEGENRKVFGACYSEHGHGHNYILEAHVQGPIDAETGMIINLTDLDQMLKEVVEPLDHRHLNYDIPQFKDQVPTTENLALFCFNELIQKIESFPGLKLTRLKLFEGSDLWAEVLNA